MTSIGIVCRGGTLLEQRYPRFKGSNLLGFNIFVHALSLQPARARTFSSTRSFGLGSFEWSDDEVVEFGQDIRWQKVDLEFNLLGALQCISVVGMGIEKEKKTHISNLGDTFVNDLNHSLEFLTIESLNSLGQVLLLLKGQNVIVSRDSSALLARLLRGGRLL